MKIGIWIRLKKPTKRELGRIIRDSAELGDHLVCFLPKLRRMGCLMGFLLELRRASHLVAFFHRELKRVDRLNVVLLDTGVTPTTSRASPTTSGTFPATAPYYRTTSTATVVVPQTTASSPPPISSGSSFTSTSTSTLTIAAPRRVASSSVSSPLRSHG